MNPFVGTKPVSSSDELKELLEQLSSESNYYCLRYPHKISKIEPQLPQDFPSPEGQMFNRELELRWKKQGENYNVLLLSTTGEKPGFEKVGQDWQVCERKAHIPPPTETRFPKGIPTAEVKVNQRYFMDTQTATVHFVALTVEENS